MKLRTELRNGRVTVGYVHRCAACASERVVEAMTVHAPPGWERLRCDAVRSGGPLVFVWLCGACAEAPEESRAFVSLRLGIRILS